MATRGIEEYLLGDILSIAMIANVSQYESINPSTMSFVKSGKQHHIFNVGEICLHGYPRI
ncbi:hypothetical protein LV28_25465 [Pandoraea pnomenusa]|nr:hypothetical protein LV28_25465 [Pandoraea pnomenusa]